jgi:sulfopyruvate decarboxylase subunit beta
VKESEVLTSKAVLLGIVEAFPSACIVSTCGFISRELYNTAERDGNFYLVGSMGMAGPIAYGIKAARPSRQVVAIDGDGSVAMNLGGLTLARSAKASIVHIVLDNGMHESTGGQQVAAPLDLTAVATASGYDTVLTLRDDKDLNELAGLAGLDGSALVHALVAPRGGAAGRRVEQTPQELVARTRSFLTTT